MDNDSGQHSKDSNVHGRVANSHWWSVVHSLRAVDTKSSRERGNGERGEIEHTELGGGEVMDDLLDGRDRSIPEE